MARLSKSVRVLLAALAVLLVLIVGVAIFIVSLLGEEMGEVELRLRLEPGKSYVFRVDTDQEISQKMGDEEMETAMLRGFGYTWDVQEVDAEGNARIRVTTESVRFKVSGPTGDIEYDSSDPSADVPDMVQPLAAVVGQAFSMTVSSQGRVLKVEGLEAMLEHSLEGAPGPPEGKAARQAALQQSFGEDAVKEMIEQSLAVYPSQPVRVGQSWRRRLTTSRGMPMVIDGTWTLKKRRRGVATLAYQGTMELSPPPALAQSGVKADFSGTQEGTLQLDEATGCIRASQATFKVSGKMEMPGQTIEMLIKGRATTILTEKQ